MGQEYLYGSDQCTLLRLGKVIPPVSICWQVYGLVLEGGKLGSPQRRPELGLLAWNIADHHTPAYLKTRVGGLSGKQGLYYWQ